MTLSNFSSLFELAAGFNFAYTLSDEFNKNLNDKILNSFKGLKGNLKNVKDKILLAKENIHTLNAIDIPDVMSSIGDVDSMKQQLSIKEQEFKVIEKNAEDEINNSGVTKNFVYLCLFNALYSILMLFVSGFFENNNELDVNDKILNETLIVINFFGTLFIIFCLFKENIRIGKKYTIGYYRSLLWFLIIAATGVTAFFLNKYWLKSQCVYSQLSFISTIWSICLPFFHFVFYFYKAIVNSQFISIRLIEQLEKYEKEFDVFNKEEIEPILTFHKKFDTYKIKPNNDV